MTIARFGRWAFLGALAALAGMAAGCQTIQQLNKLPAGGSDNDRGGFDAPGPGHLDAPGPDPTFANRPSLPSLPAKNPHAFGIGAVLPLQGPQGNTGVAMRQGLQLAVDEVNAAGGINGQPIQLDIFDYRGDPDLGGQALTALNERGENIILVGDDTLAVTKAEQLATYPALIGFLSDYVAGPKQTPKNGVRIYLNGDQEARAIEGYIESSGIDRAAVVHLNAPLAESNKQYLLYLFSGNHNIFTTEEGYSPSEQNFSLLGQAMLRVNTGALVLIGQGPEYARILTAFDAAGWHGLVFGYLGNAGLAAVTGPGRLLTSAAYPLPDFAVNPRSTEAGRGFADAYRAKFQTAPALAAAYAYDNIRALAAAAKQAGSADTAKVRAAFIALGTYTGAAGRYDIKDDGDTEMPLRLFRADGQPLPPPVNQSLAAPSSGDIQKIQAPKLN
jgi:branched-chain amino acid transport system substrate-binding protein